MRKAVDNFYANKRRYPQDLRDLVPNWKTLSKERADHLESEDAAKLKRNADGTVNEVRDRGVRLKARAFTPFESSGTKNP